MHDRWWRGGWICSFLYAAVFYCFFFFLSEHVHYLMKDTILNANYTFILVASGTNNDLEAAFCRKKLQLPAPISESER